MPQACELTPIRPPSRAAIANLKPCPSEPIMESAGNSTSAKLTDTVCDARSPILPSGLPKLTPGVPAGSRKHEMRKRPRNQRFALLSVDGTGTFWRQKNTRKANGEASRRLSRGRLRSLTRARDLDVKHRRLQVRLSILTIRRPASINPRLNRNFERRYSGAW